VITVGESSTLSWGAVLGATRAEIDQGIGGVGTPGSKTVTPSTTTTYTLRAIGCGGTVTRQVTIVVNPRPEPPPVIASFDANPSTIIAGESSTLSWSVTNAESVVIDQGIGAVAASGSMGVRPPTTTTYTLTATGRGGTTTRQVTVVVNPRPPERPVIVSLDANPSTITAGESSTLSWSVTNADSVVIDQSIGAVAASGSTVVRPPATNTYTLTATGRGGTVTRQVTVTVNPMPVHTLCGQIVIVTIRTSAISGYFAQAVLPCATSTPFLLTNSSNLAANSFYRFYAPITETIDAIDSSLGPITTRLLRWSQIEPISSCQICSLGDPRPRPKFEMQIVDLQFEPSLPKAFEPMTITLQTHITGLPKDHQGYQVRVQFVEDLPYRIKEYWFDSQDPNSGRYCMPDNLKEGDSGIRVSQLNFPMTFQGAIAVTVFDKQTGMERAAPARNIYVTSSSQAYRHCLGAALKAVEEIVSAKLASKLKGATEKASKALQEKLIKEMQVKLTAQILQSGIRLQGCSDNAGCQAKELNGLLEDAGVAGLEELAKLEPHARVALLVKTMVEVGFDVTKCGIWLWDLTSAWLKNLNNSGKPSNGIMMASPAYPLIVSQSGQRAGFLENGQTVEEIPGSYAVQIGEDRMVIYPNVMPVQVKLTGYAIGRMNLYVAFATDKGATDVFSYTNVEVTQEMKASLSSTDANHLLQIDLNGDGRADKSLSPDKTKIVNPESTVIALVVPIILIGGIFATIMIYVYQSNSTTAPMVFMVQGNFEQPILRLSRAQLFIGRDPRNALVLADPQSSARHAQIVRRGNVYMLYDLNSTNGTYVNGQRIKQKPLRDGDRIRIGKTELIFRATGSGARGIVQTSAPRAAAPIPGDAYLSAKSGPRTGTRLALKRGVTILGRDNTCDIALAEATVSRRHAEIRYETGGYVIYDLQSTQGTFVNGQRIAKQMLREGDHVRIGASTFIYHRGS
jgi:pSer/pThr/pTyr-binding forkhead associated (FHA) protein